MNDNIFTAEDIEYRPCHCGANCDLYHSEECWGHVSNVDEVERNGDWEWIHACIGHHRMLDTVSPYHDEHFRPKPNPGDPFTEDYFGF